MGTRADFYIGTGTDAAWLGSVAWYGYEWEEQPYCPLMKATTLDEFLAALTDIASNRKDWTSPDNGWPWPWPNSFTTDMTYAFVDGKTAVFHWGKLRTDPNTDGTKVCEWPDMTDKQNVTFGERSGLIVLRP